MGKKGIASTRGVGEIYNETKTEQANLLLTKTALSNLNAIARYHGVSRSELIEQIARGRFYLVRRHSFSSPLQWRGIFTKTRSYMPPNR